MVIRDVNELVDLIDAKRQIEAIKIISVDGINGSGKTYISKILCNRLGMVYFDVDELYMEKNKGRYIDFVKYQNLKDDISKFVSNGKTVLIDAVCVLQILDNINANSDLKIYVKRLQYWNYWFDGEKFDYTRSIDKVIQQDKKELEIFSELENKIEKKNKNPRIEYSTNSLFHDILRYHFKYKPDINSDIIFERLKDKC